MSSKKGINTGGGTPKGVKKPQRRRADAKCGQKDGLLPSFLDVKMACTRFIDERVRRGEMKCYYAEQRIAKELAEGRAE